ncbi:hypothetical protein ACWDHW_28065 [Streptomyces melanosporofaciens]
MTRSTERPAVTPSPTTDLDETTALRHQMADKLAAAGHIRTPAVDQALRAVPRHAFAPGVPAHKAYANDIVATRHSDDGRITSSISAPWLQADMLEAASIVPDGGFDAIVVTVDTWDLPWVDALAEGDLSLVHVLDLLDPGSTIPRIGLFFAPSRWEGEPLVREPERCTEWRF